MPVTSLNIGSDSDGKLDHPGLSSSEILDLVELAGAAYADDSSTLSALIADGWRPVTGDLVEYGLSEEFLKSGFFFQSPSFPTSGLDFLFPSTAEAVLFENSFGDLALAFRGTAGGVPFTTGDSGDWGPVSQRLHYAAFDDFFVALDAFLESRDAGRLLVTGHSLGGAMVEFYMDDYADGAIDGIAYEAVAIASPQASLTSDSRVLNIGHEADLVFSVVGLRTDNAVSDLNVVFDENFWEAVDEGLGGLDIAGDILDTGGQHNITEVYRYTSEVLLASQFYTETDRDSRVIISLTNEREEIEEVANDFFFDDPAVILGINDDRTFVLDPDDTGDDFSVSRDDYLIGGNGDDWIEGFAGDDFIQGDVGSLLFSGGNDTMAGGDGDDTFVGDPDDLDGDTIVDFEVGDRIQLNGVSRSNIEDDWSFEVSGEVLTLTWDEGILSFEQSIDINVPTLGNQTIVLIDDEEEATFEIDANGQDIAFVIDTTGSMGDDIAAVRAQAAEIIDSVFDPERGLTDSRIAVVGFNDPSTSVILPFTDQPEPEDRKQAAIDAINGISVGGGGDFPELTFTGLKLALDGSAGEWREDAVARKIILFGDATAKDADMAAQVYALAADLGVEFPAASLGPSLAAALNTTEIAEGVSLTSFTVMEEGPSEGIKRPVPVQIFTVAIGSNADTQAEFAEIASETGGSSFFAADATEIVDALLEVINLPIYAISASTDLVVERDVGSSEVTFTVTRDVADSAAIVTLSQTGTAGDTDFVATDIPVEFSEGETSKSFSVLVSGDSEVEGDETITFNIVSVNVPATIGAGSASVIVLNDDTESDPVDPPVTGDFAIQTGGDDDDTLVGEDAQRDALFGEAGDDNLDGKGNSDFLDGGDDNDQIMGRDGEDVIIDGLGDDRLFGGNDDDILLFVGGSRDRADGGAGADTFKLTDDFFDNGQEDRLKVLNFDASEDAIDIGKGTIASIRELNKEVQITFDGDGDTLAIRGTNRFDEINFVSLETPDTPVGGDDPDEDPDDGDPIDPGTEPDGVTVSSPTDGTSLFGTDMSDIFIFEGGGVAAALGNGGADTFVLADSFFSNGVTDKAKIRDFEAGTDIVDLNGYEINEVKELNKRVQVFVGPDDDLLEFVGLNSFDADTFVL